MKIRKGDRVVVLSGKDKGREGVVMRALPDRQKVIVEGVNLARKHQKPRSADQPGGIIDKAMPIHISNVAVISPQDGKPTRVGYRLQADGVKVRICKRTGAEIPEATS